MCPYCSAIIRIRSKHIGKPGRCPKCGKTIMIRQPGGSDTELPSSRIISRKAFEQDDAFDSEEDVDDSFQEALTSASGIFKEPSATPAPPPRSKNQPTPAPPARNEPAKLPAPPRPPSARPRRKRQGREMIIGLGIGGFVLICLTVWGITQLSRSANERNSAPPVESNTKPDTNKPKEQEPSKAPERM
jgi:predicted Zn finger-like uncharacterized protein